MDGPASASRTTGRSLLCPRTRSSSARSSEVATRATARHGSAARAGLHRPNTRASTTTPCLATASNTDMQ